MLMLIDVIYKKVRVNISIDFNGLSEGDGD